MSSANCSGPQPTSSSPASHGPGVRSSGTTLSPRESPTRPRSTKATTVLSDVFERAPVEAAETALSVVESSGRSTLLTPNRSTGDAVSMRTPRHASISDTGSAKKAPISAATSGSA